jgi:hypothetical protein
MSNSDAFALKNSGLNTFLFAEVGTELNGSTLTILSVLARLGKDPWAEAARWVNLPKTATIDCLAASMAQMPLSPQALLNARDTATRLILLLPKPTTSGAPSETALTNRITLPRWTTLILLAAALAAGMAVNMFLTPATHTTPSPVEQSLSRGQ